MGSSKPRATQEIPRPGNPRRLQVAAHQTPLPAQIFPNLPLGGPSQQAQSNTELIFPHTPQHQRQATSPEDCSDRDTMAPGRRSRDTSGRFAASDDAFSYHTGKVKVKIGQSARNALGAAENVLRLAELVKKLFDNEITTEPSQEAKSILTTMGDIKGLTASVTAMKAEQVPLPSNHLGSALRVIHRSGGSTRNVVHWFNGSLSSGPSDALNNIYCPIPNTVFRIAPNARPSSRGITMHFPITRAISKSRQSRLCKTRSA